MTLAVLEKSIGYEFKDKTLLANALTHSSYANESHGKGIESNQRLEFLGDSVLGIVVSRYIYDKFTSFAEGDLSKLRAAVVCEGSLYGVAQRYGIGDHMMFGQGEKQADGKHKVSILADAVESIIAACFLDSDFATAEDFVLNKLDILSVIHVNAVCFRDKDYKTKLQELLITKNLTATYEIIGVNGPPHDCVYTAKVSCGDMAEKAQGRTKKEAEQQAACMLLKKIEV